MAYFVSQFEDGVHQGGKAWQREREPLFHCTHRKQGEIKADAQPSSRF